MAQITIIAGLGNPGLEYRETRHNIGFVVVDALAESLSAKWTEDKRFRAHIAKVNFAGKTTILAKPQTFMNLSGESLISLSRYMKVPEANLTVIYDDINLDVGRLKLSVGGSEGGHNGIADIMKHLSNQFVRYRIGVGAKQNREMDLKDYVLGKFTPEEKTLFQEKMDEYLKGLALLQRRGIAQAMNQLNIRPKRKKDNESDSNKE